MSLATAPRQLETDRLLLRPFSLEDAEDMFRIYSDVETMKYWSEQPAKDVAAAQEMVRKDIEFDGETAVFWAIVDKTSDTVIGKCTLFAYSDQNRRAEIGYVLSRSFWGRGVMTEACKAIINLAFGELQLHRIEADTDVENAGSIALLQKLGFQNEGLFRQRWRVYDEWQDSLMLGLLAPDWQG